MDEVHLRAPSHRCGFDGGGDAGGRVAVLLDVVGDTARPRDRRPQELALLEDALAQLVDAHGVEQPLHAGPQLVVAVAVVVERAQDGLDGGHEVLARRELLERLGGVRIGAQPAGKEHAEAGLERAVGAGPHHSDDPDVVEHGLAAVGGAAGEVDLELAGEALGVGVAEQVAEGGLGPRADVEHLERAGAREMAALDVAHGVAARFARCQADRRQVLEHFRNALELHEVKLDVLAGGDVTPSARVGVGDVGEHVQLVGLDGPVGHFDADHLVVAALALTVDAVVETEEAEGVFLELAVQIQVELRSELLDISSGCGVDLPDEHAATSSGARDGIGAAARRPSTAGGDRSRRRRGVA